MYGQMNVPVIKGGIECTVRSQGKSDHDDTHKDRASANSSRGLGLGPTRLATIRSRRSTGSRIRRRSTQRNGPITLQMGDDPTITERLLPEEEGLSRVSLILPSQPGRVLVPRVPVMRGHGRDDGVEFRWVVRTGADAHRVVHRVLEVGPGFRGDGPCVPPDVLGDSGDDLTKGVS